MKQTYRFLLKKIRFIILVFTQMTGMLYLMKLPIKDLQLVFVHPANGAYSLVEQSKWSDKTKDLKGGAVLESGNMCVSVYSANAEKILLEIYDKS
ncbi:MAG: hypothetical protein HDR52_04795 [Treponema sp.]|nr:hypothetical protein [Treponema sp.]